MKMQGLAACLALIGLSAAGASAAPCWDPADPTVVLDCFKQAAEAADLQALKALWAADYVRQIHRASGRVAEVARNDEIRDWHRLFVGGARPHLVYKDGYKAVKDKDADTWRIEGVSWQNDIEFVQKGEPTTRKTVSAANTTVYVRKVAAPEPHYEIWKIDEPATR